MNTVNEEVHWNLMGEAIKQVVAQGCQSICEEGDYCAYRGDNGLKCAVGFLIKDEYYYLDLENKLPTDDAVKEVLEKSVGFELTYDELYILERLQSCHDNASSDPKKFVESFYQEIVLKVHLGDIGKEILQFVPEKHHNTWDRVPVFG